ncbi:4-hydroxylaminobenzoate lyase [Amorphus orientalis]|uniref:DUF4863 domain-containing protein n=1 Tax=Amorphus orientalis TaxID=649198 RepID=A0AAE4ATR3_9HYPH|nr:DUF4863 family protein [Amorphus orientalis]MDQ0316470.1 hypothetical protein [Amorphus orientalis]
MSQQAFFELVGRIADRMGDRPLDADLAALLNEDFPKDGKDFAELRALCAEGEAEGWLMKREAGGIKFSRPVKPGAEAGRFSVDVVRMKDVRGPHHVHTTGEVGAIMPIEGDARFDGMEEGWYVYPPGSDHHPTVSDGDAYVLYFLPDGEIEFTGR